MSRQASFHLNLSRSGRYGRSLIFSLINSGRLPLLFGMALLLAIFLAAGNVTAGALFQSPQSPPEQPQPAQAPADQPQPVDQPTPAPPPEQPPAPDQPQPPADQPLPATSTDEPLPEQPTGEQPVLEPTSPLSMPFPESLIPNNDSVEAAPEQEADPDATNLVLDEAEFIDTIIVGGAYLWRCCGVFIILLIPLLFLLLYIRGRSKIIQEEDF